MTTNETRDAIHLITYIYPWLTDAQAAELAQADEHAATALAEALAALEDFRAAVRESGALDAY